MINIIPIFLSGAVHQNPYDMCILFQWTCGLMVAMVYGFFWLYSRTDFLPALTATYLSVSAVYVFQFRNAYSGDPLLHAALATDALYSFVSLWAIILLVSILSGRDKRNVEDFMPWFGVANALLVYFGALWLYYHTGKMERLPPWAGFIDYPGMNACMMCLSIPFLLSKPVVRVWGTLFVVGAIILSKSSVPYGVLSVVIAAYFLARHRLMRVWMFGLGVIPVLIGILFEKNLFHSAYRFEAYKIFMGAWWRNANHVFGTGPGTFVTFADIIEKNTGFMLKKVGQSYLWPTLHSDLLQSLFETGFIGFFLILALFASVSWRLYQKEGSPAIFAMFVGIFSAAIFDFPVRYFLMSFLTVFCVSVAYEPESLTK